MNLLVMNLLVMNNGTFLETVRNNEKSLVKLFRNESIKSNTKNMEFSEESAQKK